MSTSPTRVRPLAAAICAALLTVSTTTFAQTTASTVPVGYMTYTLTKGTTTPIGISLSESNVATGPASAVGASTITVTGAAWTPGQFAAPGAPHFVNVMAGAQVGRTLLVTGNTANTLTVEAGDVPLNATGFAVAVGDRVEVVLGDTIGSLFGNASANLALQGGTSAFTADTVQIFNGARWVAYFFNTGLNHWVMSGENPAVNRNDVVLLPERGVMIARRGEDTSFVVTGRVPSTNLLTQIPGGSTNAVAVRFPTDVTLGTLNFSGPGTWIANDSPFLADNINLWNGARWVAYYKRATDGQWREINGGATDKSATAIPAGSAVTILKRGTSTGVSSFLSQALPYSLN